MLGRVFRDLLTRPSAPAGLAAPGLREPEPPVVEVSWPQALAAHYDGLRAAWIRENGTTVLAGPFAGMRYHEQSLEGCYLPKVMGVYEAELFPVLATLPARGYTQVVNIGCADGYYAVGLALLLPGVPVWCCDIDPRAVDATGELAELNGVVDQVTAEQFHFRPEDFRQRAGGSTLVVMDIEGEELRLLDAVAVASLANADLVVEVHDCYSDGMSQVVSGRFEGSHRVERIVRRDLQLVLPDCTARWGDLDRALAVSEWRIGPTPWLWMRSRKAEPTAAA
jgi:hypothetical protein